MNGYFTSVLRGPHTAHVVLQFLAKHSTIQIPHPPYSPDLAPNDFFLYPELKMNLKGRKFDNVDMIQAESKATLRNLSKSDFISCFDNWKKRWNGLMDMGFEKSVTQIETALREKNKAKRQTVLLSATLTQGVEKLAGMSLHNPVTVDIAATDDTALTDQAYAVPKNLTQRYLVVPMKLRLIALTALLVGRPSKTLVFMATQDLVDFHFHLFTSVLAPLLPTHSKFFRLHGNLTQKVIIPSVMEGANCVVQDRVEIFQKFSEAETGVLICTDVASRGLDMPQVEWIVQHSAPRSCEDYVHRVGRTARIGCSGNALIFLLPSEVGYLNFLGDYSLKLKGMDLNNLLESLTKLPLYKLKYEDAVVANKELHEFAQKEVSASGHVYSQRLYCNLPIHTIYTCLTVLAAYISYIRSYSGYPRDMIKALPFKELHLGHAAKSICLREKPSDLGASFSSVMKHRSSGGPAGRMGRGGGIKRKEVKPNEEKLFSKERFDKLSIHPHLVGCLKERFSITTMTEVQRRSIPHLLEGKDALIKSLTGSGKTLAYAIPLIHSLMTMEPKLERSSGLKALVITPTRELTLQSYDCFLKLSRACQWIVPGYLAGGEKKKSEKAREFNMTVCDRLRKGITVLVSTPGRFLDHLEHTSVLSLENVPWFVIDEADRLMDMGFEKSVTQIETALREKNKAKRQTVLLSATLTQGVEKLAGMSLHNPVTVDIAATDDTALTDQAYAVPKNLTQRYLVVPMKLRLIALTALLVGRPSKTLVFMATQDLVDFHFHLFTSVLAPLLPTHSKFFRLHGNLTQKDRVEIFQKFSEAETGVLICTDVASRGLDMPQVEWIVQHSAPRSCEDYVHRVGRTARIGCSGNALIFLLPSEVCYLNFLGDYSLKLKGMDLNNLLESLTKLPLYKLKYEDAVVANKELHEFAQKEVSTSVYSQKLYCILPIHHAIYTCLTVLAAYISYIRSYSGYPRDMIKALPFKELHLGHAAKSICLREKPSDLGASFSSVMKHRSSGGPAGRMGRGGGIKRKPRSGSPPFRRTNNNNNSMNNKRPRLGPPRKTVVSEYDAGI
ncbi:DDX31 [Cordylochernes scorpioides]|uniref:ATP-dependent RNA helicase n=1 Tax=Cordylochernes scorpioides TaxID=51811 RepID=A0ABY6K0P6_9ARAC|nr:DDX31 [Cordylochernes scorpioides]